MAGTDFIQHARQLTYESPASPAEKALSNAMPLPSTIGPVNLTWGQPSGDALRHIWPDS